MKCFCGKNAKKYRVLGAFSYYIKCTCGLETEKYQTLPQAEEVFSTIVQQPLSGSDAEASSPKSATPTSDNGKRCTK